MPERQLTTRLPMRWRMFLYYQQVLVMVFIWPYLAIFGMQTNYMLLYLVLWHIFLCPYWLPCFLIMDKNSLKICIENRTTATVCHSQIFSCKLLCLFNRYQVLAGVIEQRFLEPLLHQHKLILSAICFAVRTGNTFLGSLLWDSSPISSTLSSVLLCLWLNDLILLQNVLQVGRLRPFHWYPESSWCRIMTGNFSISWHFMMWIVYVIDYSSV